MRTTMVSADVASSRLQVSCGAAVESSSGREPGVERGNGQAPEERQKCVCRSSGAFEHQETKPTAHAVGYCLSHLPCSESGLKTNPMAFVRRLGSVFICVHLWLLGLLPLASFAASTPEVSTKDLARFPAVEATNALGTFKVKPGFKLELVAAEPLVRDPVAAAFDENGRMFVVEMGDYSERRDEKLGRIRLLEDTDGDGRFDKSTVYAEGLAWPTAVICSRGGVFVAATPDILWLGDTNGDGRADERKVVFTGFGAGMARLNVQALPNNFLWGLDNRIHGATGPNGGRISSPSGAFTNEIDLRGRDFVFDPRTLVMEAAAGGGQHGMSFDNAGRRFATGNSRHLMSFVFDDRYMLRNPFLQPVPSLVDIPVDGPAAEVFRLSPEEPWRVIRTHWRVSGQVPGMVEGGGRASGYFTGATGGTIYRGNAFPREFVGDAFIGDAGGNLVHHKKVDVSGIEPVATRPADEAGMEFVASKDTWFRPVQFANAPDGALYILDMYREVIEHPWSIPEAIKRHLDLNSGNDRGRIYRLVPDGFKQPAPVGLGSADTATLVATLAHANGWHRDTAARLLVERQDVSAVPLLAELFAASEQPLGRLHALHALAGLGALKDEHVVAALRDRDADVRINALKLAEQRVGAVEVRAALSKLVADPDVRVRLQATFTLGDIPPAEAAGPLTQVALRDGGDRWFQFALQSAPPRHQSLLLRTLSRSTASFAGRVELLAAFLRTTSATLNRREIVSIVPIVQQLDDLRFWKALDAGLPAAGMSLRHSLALKDYNDLIGRCRSTATNASADSPVRTAAICLLGRLRGIGSFEAVQTAAAMDGPHEVRLEAIRTLLDFTTEDGTASVIGLLPRLPVVLRASSVDALITREAAVKALLRSVEAKRTDPAHIGRLQRLTLSKSRDPAVASMAAKVFGPVAPSSSRAAVLAEFREAVSIPGNAEEGRRIHAERCSSCHRAGGIGAAVGPDLITVKNAGREKLLVAILDPGREVPPQFSHWKAETDGGAEHDGIIVSETPTMVTLRQGGGQEITLQRSRLRNLHNEDSSLMPEDLQSGLKPQDLANLFRFIETLEK